MNNKILFVVMPWHSLHYPSLGTGILSTIIRERASDPSWNVETLYANIRWATFLDECTGGLVSPDKHSLLGEDLFFQGVGEWIFSSALYGRPEWRVEEYRDRFRGPDEHFEMALAAHRKAGEFVEFLADEIIRSGVQIVGLTSVFQQNIPCLSLAKHLKKKAPHITILMGGANCDGVQGPALHRNFDFLDFVFFGESEFSFEAFLSYLDGSTAIEDVPNLCWRGDDGASIVNASGPLPMAKDFVVPFHDDYFSQAASSPVGPHIEPNIVAESARGCWWGQKHHCTFCGLNGMGMKFRSKDPDAFLEELEYLITRHQSLDIVLADNILDMKYLNTVIPEIKKRSWDVRLHYEIKANFKRAQLEALRDAGVWHIQPGIESLSAHVLKLMDKGTTGTQNVKLLRDCEELNLTTTWNILAGFPGEFEEDYRKVEKQLPALAHLQPPSGATRIALERFSPNFDDTSLGFKEQRPAYYYQLIYELSEEELMDIVYVFDTEEQGVEARVINDMQRAVETWEQAYKAGSTLTRRETPHGILIEDRRIGWPSRDYVISDPVSLVLCRALYKPRGIPFLASLIRKEGHVVSDEGLIARLDDFKKKGLVFEDDTTFVALATTRIPFRLRLAA